MRSWRVLAVAATAAATVVLGMPSSHALLETPGVPNPDFENAAAFPLDLTRCNTVSGNPVDQPLVPNGWVFEGAAELFDYTANIAHSGCRSLQISGSFSGPRNRCDTPHPCTEDVLDPAYGTTFDQARQVATVSPVWKTALPVAVPDNASGYLLRVSMSWSSVNLRTGPRSWIRWTHDGVPIGLSPGPRASDGSDVLSEDSSHCSPLLVLFGDPCRWVTKSETGGVPEFLGMRPNGAIVMLGYSDDVWNGTVRFDDVSLNFL